MKAFPFVWLLILLAGCSQTASLPTPIASATPDPIQAYLDANASKSTAIAAVSTAEYFSTQLTVTVEARNQIATQQALDSQATQQSANIASTERAWNATSTANSIQATSIAVWTQRAMDITATADAASVQAFATQQHAAARSEELAVQRKEMMNTAAAVIPWFLIIAVFAAFLLAFLRWTRVRVIQRDLRGDAPLLLDIVDGVAYDADRSPTAAGGMTNQHLKQLPQLTAEHHTQTTTRDQMLDLATRGALHTPRRSSIPSIPYNALSTTTTPQVEIIDAAQAKPLFHDVVPHIIQDAIEAEIIAEGDAHE